jgi:hypothetical protein
VDTLEFFKAVWPASGNYCIAKPFQTADMKKPAWAHIPCKSIEEAVAVTRKYKDENLFFAVHTTKQPYREDTDGKLNFRGDGPRRYYREHDNMLESRAFFFDLDVGESTPTTPKYETRQEALDGLEVFLFRTGLPDPLVTSSGGGYHVYWPLTEPLHSTVWRSHAAVLHHVARRVRLRADPARTTDQSSVLRVVGTLNHKPGHPPRPCVAVQTGATTGTQAFLDILTELLGDDTIPDEVRYPQSTARRRRGNLHTAWDGQVPTLDEVTEVCEQARVHLAQGLAGRGEPILYHLGCGVVSKTQEGYEPYLKFATTHPDYTDPDTAHAKLDQYNDRTDSKPASCSKLDQVCGGDACARCPFAKLGKNPLTIALAHRKAKPPPGVVVQPDTEPAVEPPRPWFRKHGKIYKKVIVKDKETKQEVEEEELIVDYDMFPVDDCENTDLETAFGTWAVRIPKRSQTMIKVPANVLQDSKQLHATLTNRGVYIAPNSFRKVQEMMFYYMKQLQEAKAANKQFDHLGWVDADKAAFILPTEVVKADGTSTPCRLSASAVQEVGYVTKKGTLEEQVEVLRFYDKPQYLRHQFIIMCGLGSILFHATNQPGVVINASGKSGGSKSSALYAAASLWGRPKDYVMNGTETGMTQLARLHRVHSLCQLPACMDEITMIEPKAAQKFVFGATQEQQRVRLNPDGTPKPIRGGRRSNMLLCSANSSLHDLLQIENRAGTAGDMRVYEIVFPAVEGSAAEANEFLHQIHNKVYGHIGPEFLKRYLMDREAIDDRVRRTVAELDARWGLAPPERYWSAADVAALIAGELAYEWSLLPFRVEPVRAWAYGEQLNDMRGTVKGVETESGPAAVLSAFLADKSGATIVVQGDHVEGNLNDQPLREVHGAIVAHHDRKRPIIYIRKDAFRLWCSQHHKNGMRVLTDLARMGVVTDIEYKFPLGKGTKYETAKSVCFTVNPAHPEFAKGARQ